MTKTDMPEWVAYARTFIATGKGEFLTQAAKACPEPTVRQLLEHPRLRDGQLAPDDWRPLAEYLKNSGRKSEAAVVELIGLREVALKADFPERLEPEARQITTNVCNHAASLAQEQGFSECEAVFAGTLGTRAAKRREWREARALLLHALERYRSLAETEPHIYRPYVASTLNDLGTVLSNERDLPAARHAFGEALETYRSLAHTAPHIYRFNVAATLSNLGTVLSIERDFPAARRALEEAMETYRSLAETELHIHRPDIANTLNSLGAVLSEERDFQAARRAFEEALQTYQSLSETAPHVYRFNVAATLNNLGNVLRQERNFPAARRMFKKALEIRRSLSETAPHIYRSDVAMTLSNLGDVLRQECDFPAARLAFEEAVETYRSLAEAEPHIYRPDVAATLNTLGAALSEERDFPSARRAFEEALEIRRSLAETAPHIYRPDVAMTLNNLGNVLSEERDYPSAQRAFEEALEIYRSLAETEPHIYRPQVATTLNNLGDMLRDGRDFSAARRALEEALETYRSLAKTEPHIYRPDVAATLNNLGTVLLKGRDFQAARRAFEEAVEIRRSLAETEPHIYRPQVATTLNNLGVVLSQGRDCPAARGAFEEALEICRSLAKTAPHIYRCDVATTLNNLGNVLSDEHEYSAARRAFEEALEISRSLAETEPHIYRPSVAGTLNNLGNVLEELGESHLAVDVSRQAVDTAEDPNAEPARIWLAKGTASAAYRRWLDHLVSQSDRPRGFRCLAAMREGPVRALGDDPAEALEAAVAALAEVTGRLGQQVRFLIPQSLPDSRMVLAILDPEDPEYLQCHPADDFTNAAGKLFKEIVSVFDKNDKRGGAVRLEEVSRLAAAAWEALPKPVQELLDPETDHAVLISGDPYWAAFPWEALRFGAGEHDWLGLRRTLARWGPLTAASIRQLARRTFGDDGDTPAAGGGAAAAAILCPWNASSNPKKHLLYAMEEAANLDSDLREAGYKLLPDGRALLGQAAQPAAMNEVLGNTTSVIHYTGHGAIIGNEEALVLHGGDVDHPSAYFGRQEIGILKQRLGRDKLLRHRPLLVLNSCRTGRTRDFGGQREDLAWAFLAEGAEAVIASALPVYDTMGQLFGESLYSPFLASSKGMGQTLVEVRRLLERSTRQSKMWPTWTLLTYHGNPYARLPHVVDAQPILDESQGVGFLGRLAKWLGLRDAFEAAEFLREIRDS